MLKQGYYWYTCPKCGNAKMVMLRYDTEVRNFPAYCKYCKRESLITVEPKRQVVKS